MICYDFPGFVTPYLLHTPVTHLTIEMCLKIDAKWCSYCVEHMMSEVWHCLVLLLSYRCDQIEKLITDLLAY
jgi:hypothetical protein